MHTLHIFGIVAWAWLAALVIYSASLFVRAFARDFRRAFRELQRNRDAQLLYEKELRHRRQEQMVREYWEARRGR